MGSHACPASVRLTAAAQELCAESTWVGALVQLARRYHLVTKDQFMDDESSCYVVATRIEMRLANAEQAAHQRQRQRVRFCAADGVVC
jgi:hypothetical protein